jgi:AcrB/AcrD/AcrF family
MAVQYNSLIDPLVIILTVPLALVGGIVGLFITQTAIGITVVVGAVLLVGIVVNNAIIMVETANQIREEQGLDRHRDRLRRHPTAPADPDDDNYYRPRIIPPRPRHRRRVRISPATGHRRLLRLNPSHPVDPVYHPLLLCPPPRHFYLGAGYYHPSRTNTRWLRCSAQADASRTE